jgi:putative RNA 2'-phosphotransferase
MKYRHVRIGKSLGLVLRHQPGEIGLTLDREGWAPVAGLLEALAARGHITFGEDAPR